MCTSASTTKKQGKYASCDGTITYAEFSSDIEAIIRISNEIFDNWQLKRVTQNDGIEKSYLTKTETKFIELEGESEPLSCSFTYHIVYHQSYQVPCLGFNVYRLGKCASQSQLFIRNIDVMSHIILDGSSILLKDVWNFFRTTNAELTNKPMIEILTEMDHPVLFTPVFMLHPCRTAELLTSLPER